MALGLRVVTMHMSERANRTADTRYDDTAYVSLFFSRVMMELCLSAEIDRIAFHDKTSGAAYCFVSLGSAYIPEEDESTTERRRVGERLSFTGSFFPTASPYWLHPLFSSCVVYTSECIMWSYIFPKRNSHEEPATAGCKESPFPLLDERCVTLLLFASLLRVRLWLTPLHFCFRFILMAHSYFLLLFEADKLEA